MEIAADWIVINMLNHEWWWFVWHVLHIQNQRYVYSNGSICIGRQILSRKLSIHLLLIHHVITSILPLFKGPRPLLPTPCNRVTVCWRRHTRSMSEADAPHQWEALPSWYNMIQLLFYQPRETVATLSRPALTRQLSAAHEPPRAWQQMWVW